MNTRIKEAVLPRDERGNDPNDHRDDPDFMGRLHIEPKKRAKPNMDWVSQFVLTDDEVEMMADPTWVYRDLVIEGHVIVIPAPPNGGKTALFVWIAGQIAHTHQVYYVNADISGGDAKGLQAHADEHGYTLMLPDMKAGRSMDDVVKALEYLNDQDCDYRGQVWIIDTFKKMTDLINKSKVKEVLKTLRGLSAKGMTIILLAHTNKYNDAEGRPIFEGTADVRADADELIYLVSKKDQDGLMTVSTVPDKVRGDFKPITFQIDKGRSVTPCEFVDVTNDLAITSQREKDETTIEAIMAAIEAGNVKQVEITTYCHGLNIGRKTVEAALKRYSKPPLKLWNREKGFQNNAWNYFFDKD